MNLIDALKSGKNFKETGDSRWIKAENANFEGLTFTRKEILSDWEIEEPKIEITREKFRAAYSKVFGGSNFEGYLFDKIAKELGL